MSPESARDYVLTTQGVSFREGWTQESGKDVVVLGKDDSAANFAVRIQEGPTGPTLELLTKQTNDAGTLEWMPSKTPCVGHPDKVIREAEYRQVRIGKNWKLDADAGVIVHKGGMFAAKTVLDDKGKNTGMLELQTMQGPEGNQKWMPAKNPCSGPPERVFTVAATRQWILDEISAFRREPPSYTRGKDSAGNTIFKHPGQRHAVRVHTPPADGQPAKLEILTTQFNPEKKTWEWKPSKKPFVGTAAEVYKKIGDREFGLAFGKDARAKGTEITKTQDGPEEGVSKAQEPSPAPAQTKTPKNVAATKEGPKKAAPKKGRGM